MDELNTENVDIEQNDAEIEQPETPSKKEESRMAFEARQAKKELEKARQELSVYKQREEESRKASLTEAQRLKEELEALKAEKEQYRTESVKRKIGSEFNLPDAMIARLVGNDEESLRADAESLAALLPKARVGSSTNPVREGNAQPKTFKESQLSDRAFYQANEKEILAAYKEGRIERGV